MSGYLLGIDIGGTFTDAVLVSAATGAVEDVHKVFTTPHEPEQAAMTALEWARERVGRNAVIDVHHGTTLVTNMLLEGRWSRVGMLTTSGFRDVIELNRQVRPDPFDLFFQRAPTLVPRSLRRGVRERVAADGSVVQALDEDSAAASLSDLVENEHVEAVVVCFVNAYANPAHEDRVVELAEASWPDLPVVSSARLLPRRGEFERFMTATVNAVTLPRFRLYLQRLERAVEADAAGGTLYMMQSSGRLATSGQADSRPVDYVESGPAAGVVGAIALVKSEANGAARNILTLDVGGTTAKVATSTDSQIDVTTSYSVGGTIHGRTLGAASSGYTVGAPVLDMVEIGAGGGSIVWVDAGGALRVGPRSAGADPGPVCYGRGGVEATLTDALVVAGVLSGSSLLGGGLAIDSDSATKALAAIGEQIGEDAVGAAVGAVEVAVSGMRSAVRTVTTERGYDPSDFALFACGGLGPTFAGLLAPALGVSEVLVPTHAGVFSAWGLTLAPLGATHTVSLPRAASDGARLEQVRRGLGASQSLVEDSMAAASKSAQGDGRDVRSYVEMRYRGQSSTIDVDVSEARAGEGFTAWLETEFGRIHQARYGFQRQGADVEFVGVRVSGTLPARVAPPAAFESDETTPNGSRVVHVFSGSPDAAVYAQAGDGSLARTDGPVIVERYDSTVLVPPEWLAETSGPFLRLTFVGDA